MVQTVINVGSNANDGTGDDLRSAFIAVNSMFTELYAASPATSQITIEGNEIFANSSNANLKLSASGTGVVELEGIQIRDNHIETTRSNDDLILGTNGTGNILLGAIKINGTTLSSDDSSAINIGSGDVLNVNTIASGGTANITFNSDITVDSVSLNTLQSSDSTAIQIDDALNVSGTLSADVINTNEISSTDSSAIQIQDDVNISGTLTAGTITGLSVLTQSSQSDSSVTISSSAISDVDTFSATLYRSAVYDISISETTENKYALHRVMIVHDGSVAYINDTEISSTGTGMAIFTADINAGNVRLRVVPQVSGSIIYTFVKTVINI
jgi:hypothetical protein